MLIFTDDLLLCMEKSKHYTKSLLELIDQLSKFVGYTIKIQKKIVAILNTNDELTKR